MNQQRKKAAALRYDKEADEAPEVMAAGKGYLAESIIEKAGKGRSLCLKMLHLSSCWLN